MIAAVRRSLLASLASIASRVSLASLASLASVASLAAVGCRPAVDAGALVRARGVDGAADTLHDRLARDPRDAAAWRALATVELRRRRPGAAVAALEAAERLGAPLVDGLAPDDRAAFGRLLVERARARVARGSPGAHADVAKARRLGVAAAPALAVAAERLALLAGFAHADPERRAAAAARLPAVDPALARGLAPAASDADVAATAAWLEGGGARRAAFELLDGRVDERRAAGARPQWSAATAARWLALHRWWAGAEAPVDRVTIDAIAAAAGAACPYTTGPDDPACDVIAAAGSAEPGGPAWEPALVEVWDREGWRVAGGDRAAAWMIVAARAVARGQRRSWAAAVRDHVDVVATAADAAAPAWARAAAAALAGGDAAALGASDGIPAAVAAVTARRATATPAPAEAAAAIASVDATLRPALAAVARGYAIDPAVGDRRADELAARAVDRAATAPAIARLFAALGDAGRARRWWQAAVDASPDEAALREGLALAMVDGGDVAAGEQVLIGAAAASGDAAATYRRAARAFAAIDAHLPTIAAARWAIELGAPGDEDEAAALAAAALAALGRPSEDVRRLAAAPAAVDLTDARAAVAERVAADDQAGLVELAASEDPGLARLALAAWRRRQGDAAAPPTE